MRKGPVAAKTLLVKQIQIDAEPQRAVDWLVRIAIDNNWYDTEPDAREAADKWESQFLELLRRELNEYREIGRFAPYTFNSSSSYIIQGCAFVEPRDSPDVREAKSRMSLYADYSSVLRELSPRQFEALCAGLLSILGVSEPIITPYTADEGIDFYGKLRLESVLSWNSVYPGIERQLTAWMIGQAKHYIIGEVSTPEIRDLVGAVELAKGKAFGAEGEKYSRLDIRVCDPIFYLFFTTGRITANSWRLLHRSGVAAMDGDMVAALLASRGIAANDRVLTPARLIEWIEQFEKRVDRL